MPRIAATSLPPIPLRRQANHSASDNAAVSTRSSGSCRAPALSACVVKTSGDLAAVFCAAGTAVPGRHGCWQYTRHQPGGLDSAVNGSCGAPVHWVGMFVSYEISTFLESIPKACLAFWQNKKREWLPGCEAWAHGAEPWTVVILAVRPGPPRKIKKPVGSTARWAD